MVREAVKEDLYALLDLYLFLHEDSIPKHANHRGKGYAGECLAYAKKSKTLHFL